jgi:hypothetical protein
VKRANFKNFNAPDYSIEFDLFQHAAALATFNTAIAGEGMYSLKVKDHLATLRPQPIAWRMT